METRRYADRREYMIEAVKKRRRKLRVMAMEYKGGKCIRCGYCKEIAALEFHHIDPKGKDFGLSQRGLTRSWEKIKDELDKCVLLCANCHREIHAMIGD
jgi:5-methylcytosine-specific restriction endonuclease McrA